MSGIPGASLPRPDLSSYPWHPVDKSRFNLAALFLLLFSTFGAFAALGACATNPAPGKFDPALSLYATEGAYATALRAAVAYRELPQCGSVAVKLCHQPATVLRLRAANDRARAALKAAEAIVAAHGASAQIAAAVSFASTAVADFSAALPRS